MIGKYAVYKGPRKELKMVWFIERKMDESECGFEPQYEIKVVFCNNVKLSRVGDIYAPFIWSEKELLKLFDIVDTKEESMARVV